MSWRCVLNRDSLNYPTSHDLTWNFSWTPVSIFIIEEKIHIYVKLISLPCRRSFPLLHLPQFSYQKPSSQLAVCSCSPLLPFPAPWFSGGCSLQMSIQMFLTCNERVGQSGYIEEGWAPNPLLGMKQGSWTWQLWSTKGKHETLLSDSQFAAPTGAKNANKWSFASPVCTL